MPQGPSSTQQKRSRYRLLLLLGVMGVIISQIVLLSPRPLEESTTQREMLSPAELITSDEAVLAPGIPKNRIADYTVEGFRYAASKGTQRQWYLVADRAFLYQRQDLVHAVNIEAQVFDTDGKKTLITGKEAKYQLNDRDIEIFGDVVATFPDGFVTRSPYMRYVASQRMIEVPIKHPVSGDSQPSAEAEMIHFDSRGLNYSMKDEIVRLPRNVHFVYSSRKQIRNNRTTLDADKCEIDRRKSIADFTMDPKRPSSERFVQINEPTLFSRSRRARINYGNTARTIHYMTAEEDVFVRERDADNPSQLSLRYATSGRAEFDNRRNVVELSEFPQVYENNDTMTGDLITLHRDSDLVEVEHSNAYSEGQPGKSD